MLRKTTQWYTKKCINCGKEFVSESPRFITCSTECRNDLLRKKDPNKKPYCLIMKDGKVEVGIIERTYKKPPKNLTLKNHQIIQTNPNGTTSVITVMKDCDTCTLRIAKICKRKTKNCPYKGVEKI